MKKGFTLFELLTVIIIIGFVAAMGIPSFSSTREKAADKQAISNLKIMQAAEKAYMLDAGTYYPASGSQGDTATINQNLGFSLPTGSQRLWNYTVYSTGCAQATRNGNDSRSWYLHIDTVAVPNNDPDSITVCP